MYTKCTLYCIHNTNGYKMNTTQDSIFDELLTIQEVCEKLKISRLTLRKLTNKKGIEIVKIGGSIRYTTANLQQLIGK